MGHNSDDSGVIQCIQTILTVNWRHMQICICTTSDSDTVANPFTELRGCRLGLQVSPLIDAIRVQICHELS